MSEFQDTYLLGRNWEVDDQGRIINSNYRRLAELINEYDSTMWLVWCPPENRQPGDTHPFAVMHEPPGKPDQIVFTLEEAELAYPHKVLARVAAGDTRKRDVFTELEINRLAEEAVKTYETEQLKAEADDLAAHIWKSGRARYRHNGAVYE